MRQLAARGYVEVLLRVLVETSGNNVSLTWTPILCGIFLHHTLTVRPYTHVWTCVWAILANLVSGQFRGVEEDAEQIERNSITCGVGAPATAILESVMDRCGICRCGKTLSTMRSPANNLKPRQYTDGLSTEEIYTVPSIFETYSNRLSHPHIWNKDYSSDHLCLEILTMKHPLRTL